MKKMWICFLAFTCQDHVCAAPLTAALSKVYNDLKIPESSQNFSVLDRELRKAFSALTPEKLFNDSSLRMQAIELFKIKNIFDANRHRSLSDLMNEGILEKKELLPVFDIHKYTAQDMKVAMQELSWFDKWNAVVSKNDADFNWGKGWLTYHKLQDFLFFTSLAENINSFRSKKNSPQTPCFQIKEFDDILRTDCQGLLILFKRIADYEYKKNHAQCFDFLDPIYEKHSQYLELKYLLYFKYEKLMPEQKKPLFFNDFSEKHKDHLFQQIEKERISQDMIREQLFRISDKLMESQKQKRKLGDFSTTQQSQYLSFSLLLKQTIEENASDACDILGNKEWFLAMVENEILNANKNCSLRLVLRKTREYIRKEKKAVRNHTLYCAQVEILKGLNAYKSIYPIFSETEYLCQAMEQVTKENFLTQEMMENIIEESIVHHKNSSLKMHERELIWHIRLHYGAQYNELQEIDNQSFLARTLSKYLENIDKETDSVKVKPFLEAQSVKKNIEKITLETACTLIEKYLQVHEDEESFQNIAFDAQYLKAAGLVYQETDGIYPQLKEVDFLNQLLGYIKGLKKRKKMHSEDFLVMKKDIEFEKSTAMKEEKNIFFSPKTSLMEKEAQNTQTTVPKQIPSDAFLKKKGSVITTRFTLNKCDSL